MSQPVKFTFERRFQERRRPGFVYAEEERTITRAEHDAAIEAARARGHAEGREEARTEENARLARAFEVMAQTLELVRRDVSGLEELATAEAIRFAQAFSAKLAGDLATRLPLGRIEEAMLAVMRDMRGAPHLALRVAPDLVDATRACCEKLAREHGFEGRIVVLGDPDAAVGDAHMEWAEGGVVIHRQEIEQRIAGLVEDLVAEAARQPA